MKRCTAIAWALVCATIVGCGEAQTGRPHWGGGSEAGTVGADGSGTSIGSSGDGSSDGSADAPGDADQVVLLPATPWTVSCFDSPAGEGIENVADGDPLTKLLIHANAAWVRFDVGEPRILSHYAITSANDFPERDPVRWLLKGSNDGKSWEELDVRKAQDFATRFERQEFTVETPALAYRYYLLEMENESGGSIQLSEVELHGRRPFAPATTEAPAAADTLTATPVSRHQVDLTWRDNADDETFFRIEQSSDGATFETIGYAPADETQFSVLHLEPGSTSSYRVIAQNGAGDAAPSNVVSASTLPRHTGTTQSDGSVRFSEGGYSVILEDRDGAIPQAFKDGVVEQFFLTYPAMAAAYAPNGVKEVRVIFDPEYEGIAAAYAGTGPILISAEWAKEAYEDAPAVMTHEGFHVLQNYPSTEIDTHFAVEGLADFNRWEHGAKRPLGCWTMQRYEPGHKYTDGYGVTARFLLWIGAHGHPSIAKDLDAALRAGQYGPSFWTSTTGKTVEQLWAEYAADPAHDPVSYQ